MAKLLVSLALLACMLLCVGAALWYIVFTLIPPHSGPLHWIIVLVLVLAGIGLGMLSSPRRRNVQP